MNINFSAASDGYGAYEDDYGETSPMADFDGKLTKMASNCLTISTPVEFLTNMLLVKFDSELRAIVVSFCCVLYVTRMMFYTMLV